MRYKKKGKQLENQKQIKALLTDLVQYFQVFQAFALLYVNLAISPFLLLSNPNIYEINNLIQFNLEVAYASNKQTNKNIIFASKNYHFLTSVP